MYRELIRETLAKRIRIDTRSLAFFRVLAGVLIIADVLLRLRNFHFFYTDAGVLPMAMVRDLPGNDFSIFFISSEPSVTLLLFIIHALIATQLILGYYTRFAIVASFLFVVSLDQRSPLITSYADIIFRHLLFWGMFLPLGARFSIDSIRRDRDPLEFYQGYAAPFALLTMIFMYFVNGTHKLEHWHEDWLNGDSMTAIMHYDSITFLLGNYVREIDPLLWFGGITWYHLMLGAPLMLVVVGRVRYLMASVYAGGHLFLAVTVRIGAFPFAALMGLSLFFQSEAWKDGKRVANRVGIPYEQLIASVHEQGQHIESQLPRLQLRNRVPEAATAWDRMRPAAHAMLAAFILLSGIFMVIPNLQTAGAIDEDRTVPAQTEVEEVQQAFRLAQPSWRFYPGPVTYDEYFVFAGETAAGTPVDVYNDRLLSYDRPHGVNNHKQLDTYRDRFYMYSIMDRAGDDRDDGVLDSYQEYYCENYQWEGEPLERLNMYYIREDATMETVTDWREYDREIRLIDAHGCGNNEAGDIQIPPPRYTPDLDPEMRAMLENPDGDERYIDYLGPS